jgi:hypothetical protein
MTQLVRTPDSLPLKRGCRIGKRRLCINCNTGDPGLEDVVGPESVWDSLHRLRLFLIVRILR